jgi:hypothetical protein
MILTSNPAVLRWGKRWLPRGLHSFGREHCGQKRCCGGDALMNGNLFVCLWICLAALGCSADDDHAHRSGTSTLHSHSVVRVVDSMNELAASVQAHRRFSYRLLRDCQVRAERLLAGNATERATFQPSSVSANRFEYAPGLGYGLRIPAGREGAMVSIFDADRAGAIQTMERLLEDLASACTES